MYFSFGVLPLIELNFSKVY